MVLPSRLPPKHSSISRCQCAVTVDPRVAYLSLLGITFCFYSNESRWMYVMRNFNELSTESDIAFRWRRRESPASPLFQRKGLLYFSIATKMSVHSCMMTANGGQIRHFVKMSSGGRVLRKRVVCSLCDVSH